MPESLLDFIENKEGIKSRILLEKFSNPNIHKIGQPSYDYSTYILFRKRKDLDIRKYPNTIGVSVSVLQELIKRNCKLIIIKVDGIARYKISPDEWLRKGIVDQLTPTQEPHSFIQLSKLRRFL